MKEEVIILYVFVSHHTHVYARLRKVTSIQHSRHFIYVDHIPYPKTTICGVRRTKALIRVVI